MNASDARDLRKVSWVSHALEHLHHQFRPLTAEEAALGLACGRFQDGEVSKGCGKPFVEGDLVDWYFQPKGKHFTPAFCRECEASFMQESMENDWEWRAFNEDTLSTFLSGYLTEFPVEKVKDYTHQLGHRLGTAVERACYFDDMETMLRPNLPLEVGSAGTLAEWYRDNPSWRQEKEECDSFLALISRDPTDNEKEWARFWLSIIEESRIDLAKYPRLKRVLEAVAHKRNRFEILFEE